MKFLSPLLLLLTACSSVSLTPAGEKVRVVEHRDELSKRCRVTGKLETSSSQVGNAVFLALHDDDAKKRLMNMAAEKGDTVYIYKSSSGALGSQYQAYVLRCHFPRKRAAPPGAPATAPEAAAPPAPAQPAPRMAPPSFAEPENGAESQPDVSPDPLPEAAPAAE